MIGTYYYPEQWPQAEWGIDFKRMQVMGLKHVHMAEFAWSRLEPSEGQFDFGWLDRAVALAAEHNLDIILCTPTATPPVWLSEQYPEALMVLSNGRRVTHGSRAHRCTNSPVFNRLAERITKKLAKHYGHHPGVIGWQVDNEVGHYQSAPCYCDYCRQRFRDDLRSCYGSIEALNQAWGGSFWSQDYQRFSQIPLPNPEVLPHIPNERARLEFLRVFSRSQARFLERQAALLRRHLSRDAWITHNFIGNDKNVYPRHVQKGLDLFTLTTYPVSGTDDTPGGGERFRIGDPMLISFQQDFCRGHNGRWGVMEQQPGQVNWGTYNSRPYPGAVRLWLWTAIAHGAELLDTYRFRQPRSGCEQYHEGLVALDGETLSQGGEEFVQVAGELKALNPDWREATHPRMRRAAIFYHWDSLTALALHPQSADFDPIRCWLGYYRVLKQYGFQVDILTPGKGVDLSPYEVVCAALVDLITDTELEQWRQYAQAGGHLVVSPRCATRTPEGHFPKMTYGQRIGRLVGANLAGYDVLPRGINGNLRLHPSGHRSCWRIWGEQWHPPSGAARLATYEDQFYQGQCAAFRTALGRGTVTVVGVEAGGETEGSPKGQASGGSSDNGGGIAGDLVEGGGSSSVVGSIVGTSLNQVLPGLIRLPEGCLYHTRDRLGVFLNYNGWTVEVPDHLAPPSQFAIGQHQVPPTGVAVWLLANHSVS